MPAVSMYTNHFFKVDHLKRVIMTPISRPKGLIKRFAYNPVVPGLVSAEPHMRRVCKSVLGQVVWYLHVQYSAYLENPPALGHKQQRFTHMLEDIYCFDTIS
jgi:hypothetical protein